MKAAVARPAAKRKAPGAAPATKMPTEFFKVMDEMLAQHRRNRRKLEREAAKYDSMPEKAKRKAAKAPTLYEQASDLIGADKRRKVDPHTSANYKRLLRGRLAGKHTR